MGRHCKSQENTTSLLLKSRCLNFPAILPNTNPQAGKKSPARRAPIEPNAMSKRSSMRKMERRSKQSRCTHNLCLQAQEAMPGEIAAFLPPFSSPPFLHLSCLNFRRLVSHPPPLRSDSLLRRPLAPEQHPNFALPRVCDTDHWAWPSILNEYLFHELVRDR